MDRWTGRSTSAQQSFPRRMKSTKSLNVSRPFTTVSCNGTSNIQTTHTHTLLLLERNLFIHVLCLANLVNLLLVLQRRKRVLYPASSRIAPIGQGNVNYLIYKRLLLPSLDFGRAPLHRLQRLCIAIIGGRGGSYLERSSTLPSAGNPSASPHVPAATSSVPPPQPSVGKRVGNMSGG